MPVFGDYETVGEPLAVQNLPGHSSTVWKAQRAGANDKREYIVKSYASRRTTKESGDTETLHRDRGLEFVESIKQLKKAHAGHSRYLTPVYDLGISPEGAWYVTDFYPRGSLSALIGRRAKVDSAALKQIVRCIVAGCLALKKARGVSHGNLKASNVFLSGKPQPLPKTPLVLADPVPAAPLQVARLESDDRKTVDDLVHQAAELQDLRALGEILLQVVERRVIRSGYCDPPQRSELWDSLGKDGERWRELCVRLLDPQLSLAETNFESLAKKFPAHAASGKTVTVVAAVIVVCLVGVAAFGLLRAHNAHAFEAAMNLARAQLQTARQESQSVTELSVTSLVAAGSNAARAVKLRPQDQGAAQLQNDIQKETDARFGWLMSSATNDNNLKLPEGAIQKLKLALALKPGNSDASSFRGHIQINGLLADGNNLLDQREYAGAQQKFGLAVELAKGSGDSAKQSEAETGQQCASDLVQAAAAKNLDDQINSLEAALKLKSVAGVSDWLTKARKQRDEGKTVDTKHKEMDQAVTDGNKLLGQGDYRGAQQEFNRAVELAKELNDSAKQTEAEKGQKCAYDLVQAAAAKTAPNITNEIAWLEAAQSVLPVPGVEKWLNDARQRFISQQRAGENFQDMTSALTKANQFLAKGDYANAGKSYGDAANFAKALNDAKTQSGAENGQKFANDLLQAAAAKEAGNFKAEVDLLEAARTILTVSGVDDWLKDARHRLSLRQTAEANYRDMTNNLGNADQFLARGDYGSAEKNFETAANLAAGLNDPKTQKSAADGAQCAQYLIQAGSAGTLEDKIDLFSRALKLKALSGIDSQLTDAKKMQEEYHKNLSTGQESFAKNDFSTAADKAAAALKIEPYSVEARNLKQQVADAQNAQNDFNNADYLGAGKLCETYPGVEFFKNLAATNSYESNQLAKMTDKFNSGDYSFLDTLENAGYRTKPHFKDLLTKAPAERSSLQRMETLKNQTNWDGLITLFTSLGAADFLSKSSFVALKKWADQQKADQQTIAAQRLINLDTQLATLCKQFGVSEPSWQKAPQNVYKINNQALSNKDIENYETIIGILEKKYSADELGQKGRSGFIKRLKDSVLRSGF